MGALPGDDLLRLIAAIRAGDERAWATFLEHFAALILQTTRIVERDADAAADAFVYACERLREKRGLRLEGYAIQAPGSFEAWLRVVVINLSRDARRKRVGRFRPFATIRRLSPIEQRWFGLRLAPEFPGMTMARAVEIDAALGEGLTSRQR